MLAVSLFILAIASIPNDSITVRKFSLVTNKGENVFHKDFDRRRLMDSFRELALKFHAVEKQFEFEFRRSYPIFAPGATIKMTGRVRTHRYSQPDS